MCVTDFYWSGPDHRLTFQVPTRLELPAAPEAFSAAFAVAGPGGRARIELERRDGGARCALPGEYDADTALRLAAAITDRLQILAPGRQALADDLFAARLQASVAARHARASGAGFAA